MSRRPSIAARARLSMAAAGMISVAAAAAVFFAGWTSYSVRLRGDELQRQVVELSKGLESQHIAREVGQRLFLVQARLIGAQLSVTDAEGNVVYSSAADGRAAYAASNLGAPGPGGVVRDVRTAAGKGQLLVVGVRLQGGEWLVATQPVREIRGALKGMIGLLVAGVIFAVAVAWLAGGWLAGRLARPLVRLHDAAEAVAEGEWGRTVLVEGDDEVASLARSFNKMSAQVSAAYAAQKSFVGDVSHELRTPITSISGWATALSDGTVADDEGRQRALGVIRDESARLGDLTSTLLALADLDAGVVELATAPVDTSALAATLGARFLHQAEARAVRLEVDGLGPAPLGDEARLLQAATTLVDNALRHTPAGGFVRLSSERAGSAWRLHVDDSGPGVPPESREAVFERFTRLESSRDRGSGGSGLGLALCRRLVRLMGGRVWAAEGPLGGARFTIELPLAS